MSVAYRIAGLDDALAAHIRENLTSPEYGHPAVREVARGTGPCRSCLDLFAVGREERLLFTYRSPETDGTLGAPGPVFIHADQCSRYDGSAFPPALRTLPLLFEARARGNRILAARNASGEAVDSTIDELLAMDEVDYLHVRHGEAGCHIARLTPMMRA
jgi:hypothetical protein